MEKIDEWAERAAQALRFLSELYDFKSIDVHAGPLTGVESVNISWGRPLSYISIALPEGETRREAYAEALRKAWNRAN